MTVPFVVLGAPSSAGAFAPGQELAPAALRDVGLLDLLRARGVEVSDLGDVEGFRWRPDRAAPLAQNADVVARVAGDVAGRVAAALADGTRRVLVLGGDCTVGVGTVAGVARGGGHGLVYVDMHADLNTPASAPDGAFDWMGMAHMLGVEGTHAALRAVGGAAPLLDASRVAILGHRDDQATAFERAELARRGLPVVPLDALRADPAAAARDALARLDGRTRLAVHLDVDLVDFVDAPLSENTGRNIGAALDEVFAAVAVLADDRRVVALTVTELNPLHGEQPGDVTLRRFAEGLAAALAASAQAA